MSKNSAIKTPKEQDIAPPSAAKTKQTNVKMTESEHALFTAAADELKLSLPDFFRAAADMIIKIRIRNGSVGRSSK